VTDFRGYCPDDDRDEFHRATVALVGTLKDTPEPKTSNQGHAKRVERNLAQLRNALTKVMNCEETRAVILNRELAGSTVWDDPRAYSIVFAEGSMLFRLQDLLAETYTDRSRDGRRGAVAICSAALWRKHGGKVTRTEGAGDALFTSYLERVCLEAGLGFSPSALIKDFWADFAQSEP
jgi:hypothetical protein